MLATFRSRLSLVIGVVMILLALFIPVSVLGLGRRPVTGTLALDLAFGAFFLLRGAMNVRRGMAPPVVPPVHARPGGENPERREG